MSRPQATTSLDWLDTLPADWQVGEIGQHAWVRARLGWKGLTADEYVDDGIPMLATPDIKFRDIDYSKSNRISPERYDESPEIKLRSGDVLLTKDGSTIGTVNIVRELHGLATVNGSIAVLTVNDGLDARYLYWFIASSYAQSLFDRLRGGAGVPHLFQRDINRIRMPLPPLREQLAIADFLDRETARIDTLIEEQQRLIELLHERRGRVAYAAFHSHTKLTPLKHFAEVTVGIVIQPARWYAHAGVPAIRGLNVKRGYLLLDDLVYLTGEGHQANLKSELRTDDVLVVRTGQAGAAAKVPVSLDGANAIDVLIVRPRSSLLPDFLVWYLNSPIAMSAFENGSVGAVQGHFNVGALRELLVPEMALDAQRQIVARLDEQTAKIDTLGAESERFVELARERRAALITEAVTGQVDVRAMVGV